MRFCACCDSFLIILMLLFAGAVFSQNAYAPDTPEPGSVEAIRRDTTEPRYCSPWVEYVPESNDVPSPQKFFGHIAGAAGELTRTAQIYAYYRELERTSKRVKVEVIGKSEEGRDILLVAVADEAGIHNLDRLKQATADLADPRKTTPEKAREIIAGARPIYYFNAAIHADESVSPDMALELVYRLAVSEQPMIQRIREKLIVLINPVANPDGRDKMADWYYKYLKGKYVYDTAPRMSPPYWTNYVYVDANRDAHQMALNTTKAVYQMFFEYHPTVIHDLHEAIALLQTWNGTGPYNPNLDPIVLSQFLEMSFHEMSTMNAFGMPGVWTWDFGEAFGHHYTDSIAMNHNSTGRGYETFANAIPETMIRKLDPSDVTREWFRPSPPPETTFLWSHRDGLNYAETGCLAILDYTARNADQMLWNFYQMGYNSWQKGKAGNPYAFVIPEGQPDRRRVALMINRLRHLGIEIGRADTKFHVKEGDFPSGAYVVRLDQPYRNYAVDLLIPQEFPNDWEHAPYDDVSWAFPVHYGVETKRIDDESILKVPLTVINDDVQPAGAVSGPGPVFLLKDAGQEALLALRYRLAKFKVKIAEDVFGDHPRGSWIIPAQSGVGDAISSAARELGLDFDSAAAEPQVKSHDAPVARLGIWVPWADTDMIGWIRYTLDHEKIPYTYLRDEEIRAGDLKKNVDVIVYGNVLMDLQGQIHGIAKASVPLAYKKTPDTPSLGTPAESEDISGGIGWGGLDNLQKFVEDGGVLITLGAGSTLVLESGLVPNVKRAEVKDVRTPGAELRARFLQPAHPIAYGYPEVTSVFRSNFALYDPPKRWLTMSYCTACLDGPWDLSDVVLQWGTLPWQKEGTEDQPLVVSGGAKNAESVEGRPAILDVPLGRGRVIVYNFNPMHRDLNYSDFRFLWNAILNWQYITQRK